MESNLHTFSPQTRKWSRSPKFYQQIRADHLAKNAHLAKALPTTSSKLDVALKTSVWVYADTKTTITHIRRAIEKLPIHQTWRSITAYDLVQDFLSDNKEMRHGAVIPDHLFIMAGYSEPPNRYVAPLLRYTMLERQKAGKKTWLFTPMQGEAMSNIWGPDTTPVIETAVERQFVNLLTPQSERLITLPWASAAERSQ